MRRTASAANRGLRETQLFSTAEELLQDTRAAGLARTRLGDLSATFLQLARARVAHESFQKHTHDAFSEMFKPSAIRRAVTRTSTPTSTSVGPSWVAVSRMLAAAALTRDMHNGMKYCGMAVALKPTHPHSPYPLRDMMDLCLRAGGARGPPQGSPLSREDLQTAQATAQHALSHLASHPLSYDPPEHCLLLRAVGLFKVSNQSLNKLDTFYSKGGFTLLLSPEEASAAIVVLAELSPGLSVPRLASVALHGAPHEVLRSAKQLATIYPRTHGGLLRQHLEALRNPRSQGTADLMDGVRDAACPPGADALKGLHPRQVLSFLKILAASGRCGVASAGGPRRGRGGRRVAELCDFSPEALRRGNARLALPEEGGGAPADRITPEEHHRLVAPLLWGAMAQPARLALKDASAALTLAVQAPAAGPPGAREAVHRSIAGLLTALPGAADPSESREDQARWAAKLLSDIASLHRELHQNTGPPGPASQAGYPEKSEKSGNPTRRAASAALPEGLLRDAFTRMLRVLHLDTPAGPTRGGVPGAPPARGLPSAHLLPAGGAPGSAPHARQLGAALWGAASISAALPANLLAAINAGAAEGSDGSQPPSWELSVSLLWWMSRRGVAERSAISPDALRVCVEAMCSTLSRVRRQEGRASPPRTPAATAPYPPCAMELLKALTSLHTCVGYATQPTCIPALYRELLWRIYCADAGGRHPSAPRPRSDARPWDPAAEARSHAAGLAVSIFHADRGVWAVFRPGSPECRATLRGIESAVPEAVAGMRPIQVVRLFDIVFGPVGAGGGGGGVGGDNPFGRGPFDASFRKTSTEIAAVAAVASRFGGGRGTEAPPLPFSYACDVLVALGRAGGIGGTRGAQRTQAVLSVVASHVEALRGNVPEEDVVRAISAAAGLQARGEWVDLLVERAGRLRRIKAQDAAGLVSALVSMRAGGRVARSVTMLAAPGMGVPDAARCLQGCATLQVADPTLWALLGQRVLGAAEELSPADVHAVALAVRASDLRHPPLMEALCRRIAVLRDTQALDGHPPALRELLAEFAES